MFSIILQILTCTLVLLIVVKGQQIRKFDLQLNHNDVNQYRLMVTHQNMEMINNHNSNPNKSYSMKAYPQIIGLTFEQYRQKYLPSVPLEQPQVVLGTMKQTRFQGKLTLTSNISLYFDLRRYIETSVRNNRKCVNGYAYATVDHIDMLNKRNGLNKPLSFQHLTDCSSNISRVGVQYANSGCSGGLLNNSLNYVMKYGLYALSAYGQSSQSLKGENSSCRTIGSGSSLSDVYKIKNYTLLQRNNPNQRATALVNRYSIVSTVSVNQNFISYQKGVFSDCDKNAELNNWGVIVGFGYKSSYGDFWNLKMNWGKNWGEGGYIRIDMHNDCGVLFEGYIAL